MTHLSNIVHKENQKQISILVKERHLSGEDFDDRKPAPPNPEYSVEFNGSYIDLTVTRAGKFSNKYSIENAQNQFRDWCIMYGHGIPDPEVDYDPEEGSTMSVFWDTKHCTENAELILDYCLEQIKQDFK